MLCLLFNKKSAANGWKMLYAKFVEKTITVAGSQKNMNSATYEQDFSTEYKPMYSIE